MMGYYSYPFLAVGWCLHAVFASMAAIGVILFVVWAVKLKPDQLKKWVMWLLIVGVLGSLLTASFSFMGWRGMMGNWDGKGYSLDANAKDRGGWNMMNWATDQNTKSSDADTTVNDASKVAPKK